MLFRIAARRGSTAAGDMDSSSMPMARKVGSRLMSAPSSPQMPIQMPALRAELGIGTNMTLDWQLVKLEKLGLLSYFSFVVSSEEAGVEKPHPGLFALCAEKAGVSPEECLFVGDSLKGDVLGAEKAGMRALWYAPEQSQFQQHPGFSHFSQLKKQIDMV